MRLIALVSAAFVLLASGPAFAQEWIEYASQEDFFTVNFPVEPTVREITFPTEYRATLPARVYSAENGRSRYSVTVVDYTDIQAVHARRLEGCDGASRTEANLCTNPWVGELRGALDYAVAEFLQRDAKVTDYSYYNAERVEGRRLQITNADRSRTFAAIHMHENRLYIFEGTVPQGAPPPGLFQQSLGFIDEEGIRVRYESPYANLYPAPPRVQYGQESDAPDLTGMQMGETRHFTEGPFAGQTWGVDGSGGPYRVEEGSATPSQGAP
ncbi:MAG: hypothetical protein O2930_11120 [Acidobacteria bacterium]|nr:hypothetical protein [Acidobacteriota bacterium]